MPTSFQARTERDLKRPGYCAITHIRALLAYGASGRLHKGDAIPARRLQDEFTIPRSEVYLVMSTLRHLGFLDEQNRLTDTYEELALATGEDYPKKFKAVLDESYADFNGMGLDVVHASQQDFKQAFQACNYEPIDMQVRMIALYKGLARMAGILPDDSKESQEGKRQIASTPSSLNAVPLAAAKDTPMQKPSQLNGLHHSQPDYTRVETFVAAFAKLDQVAKSTEWNEANRALWMMYVKLSYDSLRDALTQLERAEQ